MRVPILFRPLRRVIPCMSVSWWQRPRYARNVPLWPRRNAPADKRNQGIVAATMRRVNAPRKAVSGDVGKHQVDAREVRLTKVCRLETE
jgi:hypothetical protein